MPSEPSPGSCRCGCCAPGWLAGLSLHAIRKERRAGELLTRLGVDHAQGYPIGKPAPLSKWLVEERRKSEQAARKVVSRASS